MWAALDEVLCLWERFLYTFSSSFTLYRTWHDVTRKLMLDDNKIYSMSQALW